MEVVLKKCIKCNEYSPELDFLLSRKTGNRQNVCKKCRQHYHSEHSKQYHLKHRDEINARHKQARIFDPEKRRNIKKRCDEKFKDKRLAYGKKYRDINAEKVKKSKLAWYENIKHKKSFIWCLKRRISITSKNQNISALIGFDDKQLEQWFIYQGVKIENHGKKWEIDHVLPTSWFLFDSELDYKICFRWINVRPISSKENQKKRDKFSAGDFFNHLITVLRFIQIYNFQSEYQSVKEILHWLKTNIFRYGNKLSDDHSTKIFIKVLCEIDNPQPKPDLT